MANYKQPHKFNWVSIPVYAGVAALIYSAVQFGPPWYRNLKVDEVVRDAVNQYWHATRGSSTGDCPPELREQIERKIRDVGIEDPGLSLFFDRDATDLRVTARYEVVVRHPVVKKVTKLSFAPTASTPIVDKRL
ncbi:MAG TPA: hypothetical protein VGQ83_39265 [Polyangia bacterium]|jgi:hypothetical protein